MSVSFFGVSMLIVRAIFSLFPQVNLFLTHFCHVAFADTSLPLLYHTSKHLEHRSARFTRPFIPQWFCLKFILHTRASWKVDIFPTVGLWWGNPVYLSSDQGSLIIQDPQATLCSSGPFRVASLTFVLLHDLPLPTSSAMGINGSFGLWGDPRWWIYSHINPKGLFFKSKIKS